MGAQNGGVLLTIEVGDELLDISHDLSISSCDTREKKRKNISSSAI